MDGRCLPERCKVCTTCKSEAFYEFLKSLPDEEETIDELIKKFANEEIEKARQKEREKAFRSVVNDLTEYYDYNFLVEQRELLIDAFLAGERQGRTVGYYEGKFADRTEDIYYD